MHPELGPLIHDAERNMEILIFALIASFKIHRQQERVITEPEESQAFDLKALRHFAGNKSIRSSSRRKGYVPQTV